MQRKRKISHQACRIKKKMSRQKESWWKFMSKSAFLPDRGVESDCGISFTSNFDIFL